MSTVNNRNDLSLEKQSSASFLGGLTGMLQQEVGCCGERAAQLQSSQMAYKINYSECPLPHGSQVRLPSDTSQNY